MARKKSEGKKPQARRRERAPKGVGNPHRIPTAPQLLRPPSIPRSAPAALINPCGERYGVPGVQSVFCRLHEEGNGCSNFASTSA